MQDDEPKQYYAERHGRGPKAQPLPLVSLRRLVFSVWDKFMVEDFFQEAFGYDCVDAGAVAGTAGHDLDAYFLRLLLVEDIWPYREHEESYDADTLLSMVEVLYDLVSAPTPDERGSDYHSYNDCGWHYSTFDRAEGQKQYRREINGVLRLSDPPYRLNDRGAIAELAPPEFRKLMRAPVPPGTEHDLITSKIEAAVSRFEKRGASLVDRQHAVRDLADVLEALRPEIKSEMLPKDESELFHIANGFSIRHHNRQQRGDYDKLVWLRWAFYVYLATIHAVLRVRTRQASSGR